MAITLMPVSIHLFVQEANGEVRLINAASAGRQI
jgi:hypothetical protein